MTIKCPHCQKDNKIAGWLGWTYNMDGRERTTTQFCAFCEQQITEEQVLNAETKPQEGAML